MELFSIFGRILLKDDGVEDKLTSVTEKAESAGNTFDNVFGKIKSAALKLGGVIGGVLGIKSLLTSAGTFQETMSQTDAALKSTGSAAGETKQHLLDMADAQSKVTDFSKGTNLATENLMLTFTNIKGKIFDETLPAVNNLSTAMKEDTSSAAVQLGKALNDPVKGITALSRVGVTFTSQQKNTIKQLVATGQTAKAQQIILDELNKEFGNSAVAAGQTFPGQLKILKNSLGGTAAQIGTELIKPLTGFIHEVNVAIQSAGPISSAVAKSAAVFAVFAPAIMPAISSFNKFNNGLTKLKILGGDKSLIPESLISRVNGFKTSFSGMTEKLGNTAVFQKLKSGFGDITQKADYFFASFKLDVLNKLTPAAQEIDKLWSKLPSGLTSAFSKITGGINSVVSKIGSGIMAIGSKALSGMQTLIGTGLKLLAPTVLFAGVLVGLGIVFTQYGTQITQFTSKLIEQGPQIVTKFTNSIVSRLPYLINAGTTMLMQFLNVIIANLPAVLNGAVQIMNSLVNGIVSNIPRLIPVVINLIQTILTSIVQNLPLIIEAGLKLILALVQGIVNNIDNIINAIVNVITVIINTMSQHLPEIIELGIKILVAIVEGISRAIPTLISKLPEIQAAIWKGLSSVNWGQLGMAIIQGIGEGIKAAAGGLWNIVKGIGHDLLSGFKSMFGIHSPSAVMRDEVGKYIAEGVGIGIDENTDSTMNSLSNMSKKMINGIKQNKNNVLDAAKGFSNMNFGMNLKTNVSNIGTINGTQQQPKKIDQHLYIQNLNVQSQGDKARTLQQLQFMAQI